MNRMFNYIIYSTLSLSLLTGCGGKSNTDRSNNAQVGTNAIPVANADSVSMDEDTVAVLSTLLLNDTDADGDELSISGFSQPSDGGQLELLSETSLKYTPVADFHGEASFNYTLSDGNGGSASAKVTVQIASINDIPVANADSGDLQQGGDLTINLIENDEGLGDGIEATLVSAPSNGTVNISTNGIAIYQPTGDYFGPDEFNYRVTDQDGDSAVANVSLNIACLSNCDHTFTLSWDASISPNVTGYKIYIGTEAGTYDTVIPIENVLSYQHTVYSKGTYYFAVSAVNDQDLESELASAVSAVF